MLLIIDYLLSLLLNHNLHLLLFLLQERYLLIDLLNLNLFHLYLDISSFYSPLQLADHISVLLITISHNPIISDMIIRLFSKHIDLILQLFYFLFLLSNLINIAYLFVLILFDLIFVLLFIVFHFLLLF